MAQPETSGVWTSAASDSIASTFVTDLKNPAWQSVTLDSFPDLDAESGRWDASRWDVGRFDEGGIRGQRFTSAISRDGIGFVRALFQLVGTHTLDESSLRVTFHSTRRTSEEYFMRLAGAEDDSAIGLVFSDGSSATSYPPDRSNPPDVPRDHPSRWFEPIEIAEYGSLEAFIGRLQRILDETDVDEEIRVRVQGAIDVLRGSHRAATPGETRRIEVLSVVKAVLSYLHKELPKDVINWAAAYAVVEKLYPGVIEFVKTLG